MKVPVANPLPGEPRTIRTNEAIAAVQCGHAAWSKHGIRWRQGFRDPAVRRRLANASLLVDTQRGYDRDVEAGTPADLRDKRLCNVPFAGDRLNGAKITSGRETNERLRRREVERRLLPKRRGA